MRNGRVSVPAPREMICLWLGLEPSEMLGDMNASISLSNAVVLVYVPKHGVSVPAGYGTAATRNSPRLIIGYRFAGGPSARDTKHGA